MILIDYSEETLNTMSKQQLIEYISLIKGAWNRTIWRLDNNIKYTDSLVKKKEQLEKYLEQDKKYYEENTNLLLKEIEVLKGKQ